MLGKHRGAALFCLDVFNAVLLAGLATTASVLRWVLPPGSGGRPGGHPGKTWLGLTRHEWGEIHFWIAIGLVAGVAFHLILHAGWLRAGFRRYLWPRPPHAGIVKIP